MGQGEVHVARVRRRPWTAPIGIGLMVLAAAAAMVGGVYLVLLRVPAAPSRTQQIGTVRVTFGTDPRVPWSGPAEVTLSVEDANGAPVTDAEVTVTYDMQTDSSGRPMGGMGAPGRATARMASPGRYTTAVTFPMAGQWAVRASIVRGGRPEGQGMFLVTVR